MASRTEAAPAQRAARDSHATLGAGLTRLISASLLSCRALSKPNAFPPGGDKEAALEAGSSPGHAPPSPPASRARWTPRSARRAQVAARGRRRLPWNLLLSAPDMASAGLPPAPGFADAARDEEEAQAPGPSSGWLRVAAGPRGGGTARAADTPLPLRPAPPSLPPLPSPPLPSRLPLRGHQSGYYAGRGARRPTPLLEDVESAQRGAAAPLLSPLPGPQQVPATEMKCEDLSMNSNGVVVSMNSMGWL